MKRSFTFLLAAAFLLMSGLAWGQTREEVVAYTLDGTKTGGDNGYATESTITQGDITWKVTGNTTINPWRIGGKNLSGIDRPVYSTGTISDNITKIVVTHGSASNITVNSMTLVVSSNADFSNPTSTLTGVFVANSTTTFTRPSATDWTGKYYKIIYNVSVSGSTNRFLQFTKAEFYKENSGGGQETVATPTFNPAAGTYTVAQNVTISCTTTGATIYYTTDGTTPTSSSLVYSSPIAISETTTVKAMAVKTGMTNSSVASATYTIPVVYANIAAWKADHTATSSTVSTISGDLTAVFQNGNNLYVQDATGALLIYGNLGKTYNNGDVISGGISGTSELYNGTMEFKPTSTFPEGIPGTEVQPMVVTAAEVVANFDNYAQRFVKMEGIVFNEDHNFTTNNNTGRTTTFTQGQTTYTLFDSFKKLAGVSVEEGETIDLVGLIGCYNTTKQIFPRSSADLIEPAIPTDTVDTPTFSPVAGEYSEAIYVTIACTTEGATIYYTIDGTTPTTSSTVYADSIAVSESTTLKAFALKQGMIDSEVATAVYTISIPAPTYAVTVAGSIANGTITVQPTSAHEGDTIYVTATPESNDYELASLTYTYAGVATPIDIMGTEQFIMPAADVTVNGSFTIKPTVATPTFTPEEGTYTSVQNVSINCTTEGATIYYTIDGTEPSVTVAGINGTQYTQPLIIGDSTTVKAIAVKDGMLNSQVATATYLIEIPSLVFNKLYYHTDVTEDGIYMIVDVNGGYALTSANGTNALPTADSVLVENDAIVGNIADELQWKIKAVDGGYQISPINDSTAYLYTNNKNNGLRVGTSTNNVWELNITDTVAPNYHGFKHVAQNRYLGVYNNQDWRTYTSINDNIKNTQIEIFVLGPAPVHTFYPVNVAAVTNGTVTVSDTLAEAGTVITVTAEPAQGYELTALTYTYAGVATPIDIMATQQFTMPSADVTVNATFTELAHVATPTFSPAGGSYISAQTVSIACTTEGATIYYTIDGTDPTTESTVYSEAFTVTETTTVKALAMKEGMNNSDVASVTYTIIEPMTIAEARALAVNEYALVQGVVTFIDGRNVYVQDATAGIDLFMNNNTVPSTLAVGDMVKGYGKIAVYNGLVELSGINGGNENQFLVLSSGNPLPMAVKTIAEILEDHAGAKMLQSTRVQIVDAVCGTINNSNNTPISQGENTLNIYKMPVVEGLEENDFINVIGVIGCYNNPQLRVNSAADVTFTHPAGITVNPTALSGFNYVYEEGPSTVKTFVISARSLTAPTYIIAPESFEISSFPGESFYPESQITINTYTGVYQYTIKVRLKAGLEIGEYEENIAICEAELDTLYLALSGSVTDQPVVGNDYVRISDLSQLTSGAKVVFAARYNENANEYFAMTAQASGKPEGVLFTSTGETAEILPTEITDAEDTFYWTVDVNGDNYTFTNANGDVLGYTSSTNFATGGDNTAWAITFQTSDTTAMVPEYAGFVVNNVNNAVRAIALNSNHNFGPYHTQNMAANNYNFFIDLFVSGQAGTLTCAVPTFTPEGGTYYEAQEVAIACSTADATIYYTLDGTDPTAESAVYSEPIAVGESMTIKAIAMKEGYENSTIATAEYTIILGAVTIFNQDWEGDMNGWTFVTVEGIKPWTIAQYQGNHYAYGNGYNGGANEQWCISPAFSLEQYGNVTLSFRNAMNYTGPDMELYFSNNYDGSDPTTATWVELEFNKSTGSFAWAESGTIDLANFTGDECYIGFKYTSTETDAAAWEVDDILLMGFTSDPYLTVTPASLTGFTHVVGEGPSAAQAFVVSGGNLPPAPGSEVGGVTITCDNTSYELSLDGVDYYPYLGIAVVGTLEPTTVYVRLNGDEVGPYEGTITLEDYTIATVTLTGNVTEPIQGGDWNRIGSLADLQDGDQLVIASRYDATVGNGYYAMTAGVSGKPEGVLFTSVNNEGVETLPDEIVADIATFMWNVTVNDTVITLTNAAGAMLGYSSSTNFAGDVNTDWAITFGTAGDNAAVPGYSGFVITNMTTTNRGIAKNASNNYGAYSTSNLNNADYNFYLDLFVLGGSATQTVAMPVFSVASGTYYEEFDVEITCATEGATIYYTEDGSEPTAESMVYDGPIHVSSDITLKAIAMMEGYENSNIATVNYVVLTGVAIILNQDWEGDMNGWTFVTVEGNKPWSVANHNGNNYAYANGYNDDVDNEQWCISPTFDLTYFTDVVLTFRNAKNYNGPDLTLYFADDYDGQDPINATWHELQFEMSAGGYAWTESGEISLDGFRSENCNIAFRYVSTLDEGAAAWEVDDILITGVAYDAVEETSLNDVNLWNAGNEIFVDNQTQGTVQLMVFNLLGQPVYAKTVGAGSMRLSHNLAKGLYVVTLLNGNERKSVKMIVR